MEYSLNKSFLQQIHLDQGPDEQAGDDGEEGAGDQLQEEAVEPDIQFVQQAVM